MNAIAETFRKRSPLALAILGLGELPLSTVIRFAGCFLLAVILFNFGTMFCLVPVAIAFLDGRRLLFWLRSADFTRIRQALALASRYGQTVQPEHAQAAARVLVTWDTVLTRTGGSEQVDQLQREFNPAAGIAGNVFGTYSSKVVKVDRSPDLLALISTAQGLAVELKVPTGYAPSRYTNQTEAYAASWGARAVIPSQPAPDVVRLHLLLGADPLARLITYAQKAGMSASPTATAVPVATDELGHDVALSVIESNILVGGQPGWGKSGLITAFLTGLGQVEHVAIVGLDPKRVEQKAWRPRFTKVDTEPDAMTETLTTLVGLMEERYTYLEEHDLKKVTADMLSPSLPLVVLVVDELAEVLTGGITKAEKEAETARATLLRRLVAKGRAAGFVVVAATQKPDATTVPTALRDLFAQRVAFRTGNRAMTEVILGGAASQAPADEIESKGIAYMTVEGSTAPSRVRVWWVPDEEVSQIAAAQASRRVPMPSLEARTPDPESNDL